MSDHPSLLPDNASQMQRDIEQVIAGFIADMPVRYIKNVHNPKQCRPDFLPWLAWEWSVDEWEAAWPVEVQINVVWNSPDVHRRKGTIGSVRAVLSSAGYGDAEVIERYGWDFYDGAAAHDGTIRYEPPDHWAEYRIILARPITIEQAAPVRRLLAVTAPARSRLKALDFTQALNAYDARISYDGQFTHGVA